MNDTFIQSDDSSDQEEKKSSDQEEKKDISVEHGQRQEARNDEQDAQDKQKLVKTGSSLS